VKLTPIAALELSQSDGRNGFTEADFVRSLLTSAELSITRMRFFLNVRSLQGWSRALLVGLAVAFGLNAIAHAAHQHDPVTSTTTFHSSACGYCVTFGALATAPSQRLPMFAATLDSFDVAVDLSELVTRQPRSPAQPRAPPHS
jgi:hypothetical protein